MLYAWETKAISNDVPRKHVTPHMHTVFCQVFGDSYATK